MNRSVKYANVVAGLVGAIKELNQCAPSLRAASAAAEHIAGSSRSYLFPMDHSTFSTDRIRLSEPRVFKNGGKVVYLSASIDNSALMLQTPVKMAVPFGVSMDESGGTTRYSLDLSFRGAKTRADLAAFKEVLEQIDSLVIERAIANSTSWFGRKRSDEDIRASYRPSVKYRRDEQGSVLNYPPTVEVKLVGGEQQAQRPTVFFDANNRQCECTPPYDMIQKGDNVSAIIECAGVWFVEGKFGITWRVDQIKIHKKPSADVGPRSKATIVPGSSEFDEDAPEEAELIQIHKKPSADVGPRSKATIAPSSSAFDEEGPDEATGDEGAPVDEEHKPPLAITTKPEPKKN
jgi:hypothetical protein